jgi:hypothetical protein
MGAITVIRLILIGVVSLLLCDAASAQPSFERNGNAHFNELSANSLAAATTVNGATIGAVASQAQNAVPSTGGHMSGPLDAEVSLGTTPTTYGVGANVIAPGSGINGPRMAQFAALFSITKANLATGTPATGEVDGISVTVRQGGMSSDAGGIMVNVQNSGQGFLAMSEMASTSLNPKTFQIQDGIDMQEGVIDESNNNKIGTVYNMIYGSGTNAILVQNDPGAVWQNVLRYTQDGTLKLLIDGDGSITATGLSISGAEAHGGSEIHTGAAQFSSLQISTSPITNQSGSHTFQTSDCGTYFRDGGNFNHTDIIPRGLPLGCRIDFIGTSEAAVVTFVAGTGMTIEQFEPSIATHKTLGQFSHVVILIDSQSTAFLDGQIK